ncbi:radH flavin-dependent halogenase [Cyathus striatus]|nr:radH flavin-dependent halogenase [Cyathus striatus]
MEESIPPSATQVLVMGGGPGGSYAACCLAREGLDVLLLEAEAFPRYHIGESLLPSMRQFLRFIGLEERFLSSGFYKKVGAAFKLGQNKQEGYTDFIAMDQNNFAWNVTRADADNMIFEHAKYCGATVFDQTKVVDIIFSKDGRHPIAATWKRRNGLEGKVEFDFLVDATGRQGMLSTRYFKDRKFNQALKNIAMWGYWKDTDTYGVGTRREGAPFFEALTDESGWVWFIPLQNSMTSVGIVMNQVSFSKKKAEGGKDLQNFYLDELHKAPTIKSLIGKGALSNSSSSFAVRCASDYSYCCNSYAGDHYRIIGDAGAFIDPLFSNGVHLAISGALSGAVTICASLRGHCTETEACEWHSARVSTSYTRFLVVVLSAYKQMHSQNSPILADIDEESFDRAFGHFRSIIQGISDITMPSMGKLTQDELSRTLDFCAKAYLPPSLDEEIKPVGEENDGIQLINILRSSETIDAVAGFTLLGKMMSLEQGKLGLIYT